MSTKYSHQIASSFTLNNGFDSRLALRRPVDFTGVLTRGVAWHRCGTDSPGILNEVLPHSSLAYLTPWWAPRKHHNARWPSVGGKPSSPFGRKSTVIPGSRFWADATSLLLKPSTNRLLLLS
jgi:hypothetical protein